jgi:hypothetical protein
MDKDELALQHTADELLAIGLILNKSRNELTLAYLPDRTCPELAMCIESETFFKSN